MFNPHSMYLIGKMVHEDRMAQAERMRLLDEAKAQHGKERAAAHNLALNMAVRAAMVIALAIVLNLA
jgi:hypothetical protein